MILSWLRLRPVSYTHLDVYKRQDKYDYVYESGHSGTMCKIGFSPRKGAHTLYLMLGIGDFESALQKLGKHTTGKGCLYIKKLKDIDVETLKQIIDKSYKLVCEKYG